MFWIRKIEWIIYTCAHILDNGLRIPVDLHLRDKDLFEQYLICKLFIYLFIYLFVHLIVCIYCIYLFICLIKLDLLSLNYLVWLFFAIPV